MNDFWNNISRYPRFFISSFAGLIFVIATPFRNLLKTKKFRIILFILIISFVLVLYFVLAKMIAL
jgi:uncharacterized membrane protein